MKTIFRFLNGAALTLAIFAAGAVTGVAQEACADVDGQNALYTKFTANFQKNKIADIPDIRIAADSAKAFLEKYGACDAVKEQSDYMRPWVPKLEETIKRLEEEKLLNQLYGRFDNAIKTDNASELYTVGKELLAKRPDNYHIVVPMGIVGWDLAAKNNFAHADDALRYAKMALEAIKNGTAKPKKNAANQDVYGALKYEFAKEQAINELTYAVGYLSYYHKKDKKAALPYYYELAQTGRYKEEPRIFATIGNYYVDEAAPIIEEIAKLVQELNAASDDTVKADLEKQVKGKIALFNGYAERAMDALGRAYKKAEKPADKSLKDSLYKQIQVLYERRFPEKKDGLDTYISSTVAKPMPNPTTPVTPVVDPEPTTTTTTTTSAPAGAKPAAAAVTKPVSTLPAKASVAKKGARR
jgi:hypothetical protein